MYEWREADFADILVFYQDIWNCYQSYLSDSQHTSIALRELIH